MTRFGLVLTTYLATLSLGASALFHPAPRLIWNASPSVPIGLYALRSAEPMFTGELVVVTPPRRLASFLASRGYLPLGVPLLKHVAALPGQRVCRVGRDITVEGSVAAQALEHDGRGRRLPHWSGCRTLTAEEVFLLNRGISDSLDGRYFGSLPTTAVVGGAIAICTRAGS